MRHFRNILVGVDLARSAQLAASEIGPDNREAISRAIWLARNNGARLLFFSALNMTEKALHMLTEKDQAHVSRTVEGAAQASLDELVQEARQAGVEAEGKLVRGKGWVEITHQVLRDRHDLVVVGARHLRGLHRMLFGSTAIHLVHSCPCAVWVTKSGLGTGPLNVLVASDLTPVSEEALRLGLSLKELAGARLHVLHAVEYPLDQHWSTGLPDVKTQEYHRKVQEEARHRLFDQLARVASPEGLADGVDVHLAEGAVVADRAILHFLQKHPIDLLIIGTIARGGIPGILIGNTAERLLPDVSCSVLAVKPADFQSPLRLH